MQSWSQCSTAPSFMALHWKNPKNHKGGKKENKRKNKKTKVAFSPRSTGDDFSATFFTCFKEKVRKCISLSLLPWNDRSCSEKWLREPALGRGDPLHLHGLVCVFTRIQIPIFNIQIATCSYGFMHVHTHIQALTVIVGCLFLCGG